VDSLVEEVVEEQVLEVRLVMVDRGDVLKEDGSDDAPTAPHEGNGGVVELPLVVSGGLLHEHKALGVQDDLGGVESLLKVLEELLLVALELGRAADKLELGRGGDTLVLDGRQASSKDGLSDLGVYLIPYH
jgi:hypothetical protein